MGQVAGSASAPVAAHLLSSYTLAQLPATPTEVRWMREAESRTIGVGAGE
jgi:hypothetical protein